VIAFDACADVGVSDLSFTVQEKVGE